MLVQSKHLFWWFQAIIGILCIAIFSITGIALLICYGNRYCDDPAFPFGPNEERDANGHIIYCCQSNVSPWICLEDKITIKNCHTFNEWLKAFCGNLIVSATLSFILWSVYFCVPCIR
ncbi:MAG: hypothetical protein Hyperionvirus2_45 [Hyperionvirus sp.]|uniref:Uncharacterized protein n=1 Tax=Hyperionvirus sp. TaxID=2487770 RepID=A0A3G5A620_9VIRU|nr:MAG: hypothetical protein Hyperionvirus2_45 [Hyperionvirus sp.]